MLKMIRPGHEAGMEMLKSYWDFLRHAGGVLLIVTAFVSASTACIVAAYAVVNGNEALANDIVKITRVDIDKLLTVILAMFLILSIAVPFGLYVFGRLAGYYETDGDAD